MFGGKEGDGGLITLIQDYGVVAISFHFSVWISTIALVYTAISLPGADELIATLPLPIDGEAVAAGRVALTFGIVEALGPPRLALTVAATPSVTTLVRRNAVARLYLRRAENRLAEALQAISGRFARD